MRKADRERQKQDAKRLQQRLDAAQRKGKTLGIKVSGLKAFVVQMGCGCCDSTVYFKDEIAIQNKFNQIGLACSAVIEDEAGQVVEGVDTFYGYRRETDKRRGLEYLAGLIARQ